MGLLKTIPVPLRLEEEEWMEVQKRAEFIGVKPTRLLQIFIRAGLERVRRDDGYIHLPFKLDFEEDRPVSKKRSP